jgi:hypothetical protein
VGAVSVISTFLLFLGKVFIAAGATILGVYLLQRDENSSFWVVPALVREIVFSPVLLISFLGDIYYFILHCILVHDSLQYGNIHYLAFLLRGS